MYSGRSVSFGDGLTGAERNFLNRPDVVSKAEYIKKKKKKRLNKILARYHDEHIHKGGGINVVKIRN